MKALLYILMFTGCLAMAQRAVGQEVETLLVHSPSMDKEIQNLVLLPAGYSSSGKEYPVLYLLHGAGGDYSQWLSIVPDLNAFASEYDYIIVCADGGRTSWYFDSPVDPAMRYETYISEELVEQVDLNYNTIEQPEARAISGLSMGGHGALYLAIRHQDVWGAAGSTSGGVDFLNFKNNWDLPLRLGKYSKHRVNWEENTVINMVDELQRTELELIIDCGVDDFFYEGNERLHEALLELDVPHEYIVRPGKHNSDYWANSIKYHLLFFDGFFDDHGDPE